MKALKKAIGFQTDVTPEYQHHVIKRLERFGITEERLYATYKNLFMMDFLKGKSTLSKEEFLAYLDSAELHGDRIVYGENGADVSWK